MSAAGNASAIPLSGLPLGVDLSGTLDGFFYGYAIATVLFGITIVQAWIYINTNHDKWPLRSLVAVLVTLDFVTTCLDSQILHHYLVANFGNLTVLTTISKPLAIELLVTVVIVFSVEIFFASRVYLIGRFHWIVPALIVISAIGAAAAGIATVVGQFQDDSLASLERTKQKLEIGFDSALSAFSDIVATIALSWAFARSRTGIKRTDTLLQKLFQYTVTRGLFVSVDQTILLVLILVKPEKLWWMPFHLALSKVYVITMVAMLNSRDSLHTISGSGVISDADMVGRSTIGGTHIGGHSITGTRGHVHGGETLYTVGSSNESRNSMQYRSSGGGGPEVINVTAFPGAGVKTKGSSGDGSYIEMDDYERKGVLVTREMNTEIV